MLDQQDRGVALFARVENEARDVFLLLLIHAGHRLVEDQKLRLGRERARKLDALLHAERNDLDRLVADILDLHEVDQLFDHAAVLDLVAQRPDPVEQRSPARSRP